VETGGAGLEEAKKNNFDAILMDIRLPDINGLEVVKRIRKFNSKVFIIAQTAYAMPDDQELALAAGCNEFLTKPVNAEKLLKQLSKL
jgi:CheY-like chemotaxis protein